MTREELLALPLRELDAMLAKKVMGWTNLGNHYSKEHPSGREPGTSNYRIVPHYSSDDNAVRLVRNRIEELGLAVEFICKLNDVAENQWINAVFEYMQATPQQQCVAAILAVQEKEQGE